MTVKITYLLSLFAFLVLLALPSDATAQARRDDFLIRGPVGDVDRNALVSSAAAKEYYKKCTGHLPIGFTPSARNEFCTCSSISVTQVLTHGELEAVQGDLKRNDAYYNTALIKYVEGVVTPCLETPIRNLSYITCLEERAHDNRIRNFPAYCSCAGDVSAKMLQARGSKDIIGHYTTFEKDPDVRPVESFMSSPAYRNYVSTGMRACIQPAFLGGY
jgi:hypothetical protein